MRFLALISLASFLWLSTAAPLALADTMQIGICNFGFAPDLSKSVEASEGAAQTAAIKTAKENYETKYNAAYSLETDSCGTENIFTGLVEKGDCTTQVITEITEIVSSATPDPESTEGDKIVNLYQGTCCLIYDSTGTCYNTRTYYTDSLAQCETMANGTGDGGLTGPNNCQLRQWLIASSGMGLLKLYVKQIFTYGSFVVGAIAVATIILNGVRISVAGVSGDISEAKQKITQSLSGIVLLFLSALILYSINPDFFG